MEKIAYPAVETSIDVTSITESEYPRYAQELTDAQFITSAVIETKRAAQRNIEESKGINSRISENSTDLYQDYIEISSSQTVSAAFLQLHAELTAQKVPFTEITAFFKQWLEAYAPFYDLPPSHSYMSDYFAKLKKNFDKPTWFKQGKKEWNEYVRSIFYTALHTVTPKHGRVDFTDTEVYSPRISFDQYPDWYDEIDVLPEEELIPEVQKELAEDSATRKQYGTNILLNDNRAKNNFQVHQPKHEKYQAWIDETNEYVETNSLKDLKSWLLYLKPAIALHRTNVTDPLSLTDAPEFIKAQIEFFLAQNTFRPEIVAMWIKDSFHNLGINTPDGLTKDIVAAVLELGNAETAQEQLWGPLKEADKKQYKFLRFGLTSLINTMSRDECAILAEYMRHAPLTQAITEIAKNIHSHSTALERLAATNRNLDNTYRSVNTFGKKWLADNYQQLHDDLISRLTKRFITVPPQLPQLPEIKAVKTELTQEYESLVQEKIQVNPFEGWHILYTNSVTNPGNDIIDFSSLTHDELVQELDEYLGANKISISVKTSSIVNCLIQIINTPEEIERFISTLEKKYTDHDFKKRRRGSMRILYQLDPENKTLVFNLYKKKKDMYDF